MKNGQLRIQIVCANELPPCPDCGEPWCAKHNAHYADCPCIGPSSAEEEGYTLVEENGVLYGVKKK